jgi:hypothetical protein
MLAANEPRRKKVQIICSMRPLRECIDNARGDMSKCVNEVREFERTCDKKKRYVHDRAGLDDTRSGLFGNKKTV